MLLAHLAMMLSTANGQDWRRITCPIMSAMVKQGDLVPDAAGMITKQQTLDALLHVGVSRRVAEATTNDNFDHLPWWSRRLNVFQMNTVNNHGPSDPPGALEHFRSTGIRDGGNNPQPDALRYNTFEQCARFDNIAADFSLFGDLRISLPCTGPSPTPTICLPRPPPQTYVIARHLSGITSRSSRSSVLSPPGSRVTTFWSPSGPLCVRGSTLERRVADRRYTAPSRSCSRSLGRRAAIMPGAMTRTRTRRPEP